MTEWFGITAVQALGVISSVVILFGLLMTLIRVFGLRSFSKMSAPDFAMTIAIGSLLGAAVASPGPSITVAFLAFLSLFATQRLISTLKRRSAKLASIFSNCPLMLMDGPRILKGNMRSANVSVDDLRAKLREANVTSIDQVKAVVFETTGDVSVLHNRKGAPIDDFLLQDVQR